MADNPNTKTRIAEDVEIVGTISCGSSLQLNGRLNGDLTCSGDALIGETAEVKGNMSVNSISVRGGSNGNIAAQDKIELKATAKILGDVKAKRMTMEEGVTFIGKAEINPSGQPISATEGAAAPKEISPTQPAGKADLKR